MGAYKDSYTKPKSPGRYSTLKSKVTSGYSTVKTRAQSKSVEAKSTSKLVKAGGKRVHKAAQKGAKGFFSFFGGVPVGKKGKLKKIKKVYHGDPHGGSMGRSEMARAVHSPRDARFKSLDGYRDVLRIKK